MKIFSLLTLSVLFLFGCGGSGDSSPLEGNRSQSGPGTPVGGDGKAKQEALKNKALLEISSGSLRVLQINSNEILLGLVFRVNSQPIGYRSLKLEIKNNEEKSWEGREFDLAPETRLNFRAFRTLSTDKQELLALHFKFENRSIEPNSTSSYLVLLKVESDNRGRILKDNFFYPQTNKVELRDWINQASKSDEENALRDMELEY